MLGQQDNCVFPSLERAVPPPLGSGASLVGSRPGEVRVLDSCLPGPVPYFLGCDILPALPDYLGAYRFDRLFLVTSAPIYALHGEAVVRHLRRFFRCEALLIPDGEKNKTSGVLIDLCESLVNRGATRDSVLLAFGGGVTGNVVGLAAALVYRGIRFVEMPTTLLGQTDSALSNKQAVNGRLGKNHFGVYHAPLFIWADIHYLLTEPPRMRKAGLVETVKNGLISDRAFFHDFVRFLEEGVPSSPQRIAAAVHQSVLSKAAILRRDPGEKGYAVILEYGHTVGHAVELLTRGDLLHGEAVAIGLMVAARLSQRLGWLDAEGVEAHRYALSDLLGIDLRLPPSLGVEQVLRAIPMDNKKTGRGVPYVLLRALGQVALEGGGPLQAVPPSLVREVLESMRGGHEGGPGS
jgi:3-dehydroquinate synthetase